MKQSAADRTVKRGANGEVLLRQAVPVFVNSFNQLTYVSDTLEWFWENGFRNVTVIEQGSNYPPLLEYFSSVTFRTRFLLYPLDENIGPRRAVEEFVRDARAAVPYIFTDPDLLLPAPADPYLVTKLIELGQRYRANKVGLALDISEPHLFHDKILRPSRRRNPGRIEEWEAQFWEAELEPNVFRADVDTTFHLVLPQTPLVWRNRMRKIRGRRLRQQSIRVAGSGFLARHRPWYREDGMSDDERNFYLNSASLWSNWVRGKHEE